MQLFSILLGLLMFVDMFGCLSRSNYGNAVVSFSIYLAIYVDLVIDFNNEHVMARTALVLSLFAYVVLIFFDVWYLLFGSFVACTSDLDGQKTGTYQEKWVHQDLRLLHSSGLCRPESRFDALYHKHPLQSRHF